MPSDTVAPGTIAAANVRSAVFYNRVDLEWQGVVDDANGSGMAMYQIYRDVNNANNYQYMGNFRYSNWSDTTVTAGTTYSYRLHPLDMHLNSTATVVTVVTPANGIGDPRRTGVRPLGTYWGASPENIDLQSGNLSFSLPTVTAQGRGGTAVPFRLSYNSQNWRKDLGGWWKLGTDVGYGWGWKMLAGSLTPIYSDWWTVHHYVYTDGTGAEYRLETNTGGVWSSKDGIFVEYDANTGRLYSPGGSYWEFGCRASGTEQDTGTLYPTRIVDTNGNETKIRYQLGLHHSAPDSCSGRLKAVEDVRAAHVSGEYKTYSFTYNNDAIPHLTGIQSHVPGDASNFTFGYSTATSLVEPFTNTATGQTAVDLQTMTVPGGAGLQFSMTYNGGPHELQRVTMPHNGTLDWVYGSKTLLGSRTMREVVTRITNANDGTGNKTYTLYHDDGADVNKLAHEYTVVQDATGTADKAYFFNVANDFKLGLFNALNERTLPSYGTMRLTQATWATTANGNPYISRTDETVGTTVARVEQTLNDHGNLTERKQYGYFATGGTAPLVRTFTYTYLATSPYTSRHIWNRPLAVTVVKPGGSPVTLSSNTYDIYPFNTLTGLADPGALRQHDTTNYGQYFVYRGNVTSTSRPGATTSMTYDYTGTVRTTNDGYGHTAGQTPDSTKNYAVPSAMTAGSLSTSFTWNGANELTQATGPNGATSLASYDSYLRPASKTAANGSVTTFTYGSNWTLATTGTRWTKTWVDGFGRTVKAENGFNTGATPTTVSTVESQYAPCACSPLGKLWKSSLPYAPGGTVYWTEYVYDALGRTLQVKQPNNSGTTTYSYSGIVVTVTDPAGKWKSFENDALGNLVKVTEPRPGGGTAYETVYTYSELGQLLTATMTRPGMGTGNGATVTQTRTWVYNSNMQLVSVRHPESSTVANPSTRFDYNLDGTLNWKQDAKNQKVAFTYDTDGRVTAARRYYAGGGEDTCARVDYYYNSQTFDATFTQNATGRLAATATGCSTTGGGQLIEMYSYNAAGAVTKKRLRIVRSAGTVDKDVTYTYGTDGKLATVLYPGASVPYSYTYNLLDQPTKMTGPVSYLATVAKDFVKDVAYNHVGAVTSMKYLQWKDTGDNDAPYYFTETKSYNVLQQMTSQKTTSYTGATAVEIQYNFHATENNGRITSRKNVVSGEEVVYSYDELNRLISASVAGTGGWGQTFTHDGFGNLWGQTVTKGTAPTMSLNLQMSTNRINSGSWGYDDNGNTTGMPVVGGGTASLSYDVDNRLASWVGPAGTEQYGYLADNKRVWKKAPSGAETYYFYGAGGQKLATYSVIASPFSLVLQTDNVYFGGKLVRADGVAVVHDRLGSVVARASCVDCSLFTTKEYFPYGDEVAPSTSGNVDKFGTYHRDATTGLDYADQRYFAGTLGGRFLSSDPYEASGGSSAPGSWNRYPYVGGDPVNRRDSRGLESEYPGDEVYCPETGTIVPESICRLHKGQNDPSSQFITCSDGTKVPQGSTCPTKDGGDFKGRERAHEGLKELTASRLLGKKECAELLAKLAEQAGGGATAASIAGAVERQARETYNSWTMYDGPAATTVALDAAKFGNSASGNVKTVADWFRVDNGRQGLSQQNGSAIFIRSEDWGSFYNSYTTLGGDLSSYGFGTLLHEVLHKQSVGGFTHGQMEAALAAVGFTAADNPLYKNINSSGFGSKCF